MLYLAKTLNYIASNEIECLIDTSNEIGRILSGLIKSLNVQ